MQRYLTQLFLVIALSVCLLTLFNWVIDPYWIFGAPEISHVNRVKVALPVKNHLFKKYNILDRHADTLIFGTSREEFGIDPQHPVFASGAYNGAMDMQAYRIVRLLLEVLDKKSFFPNRVVWGLLFESSNSHDMKQTIYDEDDMRDNNDAKILISSTTIMDSIKTFYANIIGGQLLEVATWRHDGLRKKRVNKERKDYLSRFLFIDRHHFAFHFPAPHCKHTLENPRTHYSSLTEIRAALAVAYRHNTDMRLFFGPSHARQWEGIAVSGHWPTFEEWKRRIVAINEEEAAKAGKKSFPLWDFSGYNSITSEDVPQKKDTTDVMKYYIDSSHYSPAAGDLVLDRMFDHHSPQRKLPDDFGVQLSAANIEAHLSQIRRDRVNWRESHPVDVEQVERLAEEVKRENHCPEVLQGQ